LIILFDFFFLLLLLSDIFNIPCQLDHIARIAQIVLALLALVGIVLFIALAAN
jgi:uncharacterized membrane protein